MKNEFPDRIWRVHTENACACGSHTVILRTAHKTDPVRGTVAASVCANCEAARYAADIAE